LGPDRLGHHPEPPILVRRPAGAATGGEDPLLHSPQVRFDHGPRVHRPLLFVRYGSSSDLTARETGSRAMADISPFRAYRYDLGRVGALSEVVAPPYDVIDPALQEKLYAKSPNT